MLFHFSLLEGIMQGLLVFFLIVFDYCAASSFRFPSLSGVRGLAVWRLAEPPVVVTLSRFT
jgi:hypothetical protein